MWRKSSFTLISYWEREDLTDHWKGLSSSFAPGILRPQFENHYFQLAVVWVKFYPLLSNLYLTRKVIFNYKCILIHFFDYIHLFPVINFLPLDCNSDCSADCKSCSIGLPQTVAWTDSYSYRICESPRWSSTAQSITYLLSCYQDPGF